MSSVPMTASAMPISPASTPRRAVRGCLSHFRESTNSAPATRYAPHTNGELRSGPEAVVSRTVTSMAASKLNDRSELITAARLPAEHLEHAVGDPKAAHDVDGR